MHARTVSFPLPPEKLDQALANFKAAGERITQQRGFQQIYWLYDREHKRIVSVAIFDTEENNAASWEQQGPIVRERIAALGVTPEVHTYEVVHQV